MVTQTSDGYVIQMVIRKYSFQLMDTTPALDVLAWPLKCSLALEVPPPAAKTHRARSPR